jgi:hypothetical protein
LLIGLVKSKLILLPELPSTTLSKCVYFFTIAKVLKTFCIYPYR